MKSRPRPNQVSRWRLPALDFGIAVASVDAGPAKTTVSESRDGTTVQCGTCGEQTTYRLKFSQGPRGSLRLQVCPNCKAMYFKKEEVVA
jgi:hypothetical protein